MSFQFVQKSVILNNLERQMALILRYFTEFGSFRCALCKSGLESHNYIDNLRLLCLVVNVCRETARRPRYKFLAD